MKKTIIIETENNKIRDEIGYAICEQLVGNPDFKSNAIGVDYITELCKITIWKDDDSITSPKIEIEL